MKKILTPAILFLALLICGSGAIGQKIGYISTQDLISVMPETIKADSNLRQYNAALYQNAKDKEDALNAAIQKFNDDSAKMTGPVKEVKRAELQKLYQELTTEDQRIQGQLEERRNALIGPIQQRALTTIQAVAKENGYTYVLEREALLVAPPGDDILPLVAKKLNIKLPPPTNATNPPAQRPPAGRQ